MSKAIILARVSDKKQEEGHSLPAQLRRLRDYANKNGFKVVEEFHFSESAGDKIRKKFEQVMKYLKTHKDVRILLCENVDRATRNFRDAVDIDDMRKNDGLEVHFVQDGFFINAQATGNQMFMWEAKVFLAKQYLNRLSDDVKRSQEEKLRKGEWPEKAPIGYLNIDLDDEHKDIIVDPERAPFVKKAFELYATGNWSLNPLMKLLNSEGFKNNTKAQRPITKSQLDDIIKNTFYYGEMKYKGKLYPHKYPPLIERWLFEKCKSIRTDRHGTVIKYASKPFVFRGLIRCADCGGLIGKDPKKGINYCVCNQFKGKHGAQRVTEENLIEQVKVAFRGIKMPEDVLDDQQKDLNQMYKSERDFYKTNIDSGRKEYDKLDKMIEEAYLDKLEKKITEEQYKAVIEKLKTRQAIISEQLKDHSEADKAFLISISSLFSITNRIEELFVRSEVDQKRQLVNLVLSNLKLEGKKLVWEYKKPFDMMALCTKNSNWLWRSDSNRQPTGYT